MYVVIVVGPVDSVDGSSNTQDVGDGNRVTLRCWTGHRWQSHLFLWRDAGKLFHNVIHKESSKKGQSTSWKSQNDLPIYGGSEFPKSGQVSLVVHTLRYLSTDNRDLSTKSLSGQGFTAS